MDGAPESAGWALKLVELLLVFGGVIAFGMWQLRDVERARRESTRAREAQRPGAAGPGSVVGRVPEPELTSRPSDTERPSDTGRPADPERPPEMPLVREGLAAQRTPVGRDQAQGPR